MSNKLPKFYISEHTPADSPFRPAAEAWDQFETQYLLNERGINRILNAATANADLTPVKTLEQLDDRDEVMAMRIEEGLLEQFPGFTIAANGLKLALDRLKGKDITWNEFQRGEVIDAELFDYDPTRDEYSYQLKRAAATYPEVQGWLIDHTIGPRGHFASAMGGYPMWLRYGFEPDAENGLHIEINTMFAIRETSVPLS